MAKKVVIAWLTAQWTSSAPTEHSLQTLHDEGHTPAVVAVERLHVVRVCDQLAGLRRCPGRISFADDEGALLRSDVSHQREPVRVLCVRATERLPEADRRAAEWRFT